MPTTAFRRSLLALALAGGLVLDLSASAARPAHAAPLAEDSDLDFRPGELRIFIDPVDGKTYWYFTYRVVNRTGAERMWAPKFEFYGDRGELIDAGKGVPTRVTKAVIDKAGTKFTQDQYQILGPILVGEENAKDGLVVFAKPESKITEMIIFLQGLSNEVRREVEVSSGEVRMKRKVLEMRFLAPGNPVLSPTNPAEPGGIDDEIRTAEDGRPLPPVPANPRKQSDGLTWIWR